MNIVPFYSVVVTAHNEIDGIVGCLNSLAVQREFSDGSAEIIFVDDRSTDGTIQAVRELCLPNLKIFQINDLPAVVLTARQRALNLAFHRASGEIILVVDADGKVPDDWIARMVAPIRQGHVDAVAGAVSFRTKGSWVYLWQNADAAFYLTICRLTAKMGFAPGVLFGNFTFRRQDYLDAEFLEDDFALTEDLHFARSLHARGKKIDFDMGCLTEVAACENFSALIARSMRISAGGFSVLSILLSIWTLSLIILVVMALYQGGLWNWLAWGRYLGGASATALSLWLQSLGRLAPFAIVSEPITLAVGAVTVFRILRTRQVTWGGQVYDR